MQLVSARAMTRLNTAFVTFYRDGVATTQKKCNLFYLSANGQSMSAQAQIGERIFPDQRVDNIRQFYHRFLSAIGVLGSSTTINLTMTPYLTDSFIYATDFEAVPEAHGSGLSTQGAQLTFGLRDLGTDATDLPTTCTITCWHEGLIEITQDGISYAT